MGNDNLLNAVANAITDEGIAPNYHRQQLKRLQKEWPVLYRAVIAIASRKAEPTRPDATAALVKARDVLRQLKDKLRVGWPKEFYDIANEALPEIEAAIGQEVKENGDI